MTRVIEPSRWEPPLKYFALDPCIEFDIQAALKIMNQDESSFAATFKATRRLKRISDRLADALDGKKIVEHFNIKHLNS